MSKPRRALEAKEKGNKLFKAGKIEESIAFYAEAEALDSENPVFPSNLSAAQYEIGEYSACADAILRSWSRKPDSALVAKLSTRLAKALCHAAQAGTWNVSNMEEHASAVSAIEEAGKQSAADHSESDQAWLLWHRVQADLKDHDQLCHEAKVRLSRFPIFRGTPEPQLTYHVFGMDDIMSMVDDWGPDHPDPIKVQSLPSDRLSDLSFLIGGVGDGRHALGTLIGLGRAASKLSQPKRGDLKPHITLLDIHPAIMARNLLLFMMINILVQDTLETVDRLEVQTTMVYVFIGWIMPSYCEKRLSGVINDLLDRLSESPPRLPSWLHVDASSVKPIVKALDYWANEKTRITSKVTEHLTYMDPNEMFRAMASIPRMNLQGLGDPVPGIGDKNEPYGLSGEVKFFKAAGGFIPPSQLWPRHQGTEFTRKYAGSTATSAELKKMAKDVNTTWKPNITIFVPKMGDKYLTMQLDAFEPVRLAAKFNKTYKLSQKDTKMIKDSPTMSYMLAFLDGVVDAVKSLGDKLQCEFIAGEINQELSKVRLGTDSRPKHFPRKWTRIWLSNIPDYTHGTLNTSIFIVPALQSSPEAAVSSNCLWNSPVWKSDDEFCYNYTMLLDKDLSRYLGIRVLRKEAVMYLLTLGASPLPRPLNSLASRENLRAWLTRLFLCILWPGLCKARPDNVRIPDNLVAFICLLVQLHSIGYPGHWLADFLQSILSDNLVASRNVWNGALPRPVSDLYEYTSPHKTRLDPWKAELEVIVATSLPGLPFTVQMPPGLAIDAQDIGLFTAKISENLALKFFNPIQIDPVISLVFYKAKTWTGSDVQKVMMKLPALIDGRSDPSPGMFYIYTSPVSVDFLDSQVQWKMSRDRVRQMTIDGWSMLAWRSDLMANATEPVPAKNWVEVTFS